MDAMAVDALGGLGCWRWGTFGRGRSGVEGELIGGEIGVVGGHEFGVAVATGAEQAESDRGQGRGRKPFAAVLALFMSLS